MTEEKAIGLIFIVSSRFRPLELIRDLCFLEERRGVEELVRRRALGMS